MPSRANCTVKLLTAGVIVYLLVLILTLLTSCENPVSTAITQAEQASVRVLDSVDRRTRGITQDAINRTEAALERTAQRSIKHAASLIDTSVAAALRGAEKTAITTEQAVRRDVLSIRTLAYMAALRDTLTGAPLRRNLVQLTDTATNTALMRVERYQQKAVEQLNKQQKTWIETTYTLAAPILAAIGGLVIIAALGFGAVRSWQRLQERRHSRL